MRRTAIMVMVLSVVGGSAFAQPLQNPATNRGYVQALGGVTFGTEPSQIFGGGAGLSVGRGISVVFEGGRMGDVVPKSVQRDVDNELRTFSAEFGVPISATIKSPATYFAIGFRFTAPTRGRIAPYAAFTVGSAKLAPELSFSVDGTPMRLADEDFVETGLTFDRQALIGVGGGVEISASRRLGVEFGYQYNRIFTKDPAINTHRAVTGVNVKF